MKKEEFKRFIMSHPELSNSVKSGKTSWQKLYELYDLYGEEGSVFDEYLISKSNNGIDKINNINFKQIISTLKELDIDTIKDNLSSIQKAVSFLEDFTAPDITNNVSKSVINPKPLEHFFGD